MSLMKEFQEKKTEDPGYGEDGSFSVLGAMPTSIIGQQQRVSSFEKELEEDLVRLKLIKSIRQKITEKEEHLVPKYLPLVETLRNSEADHPLLGQVLVWLFDIADIAKAMDLALYCIGHNVPMPERFKRDLPTFLCDTVVEWAEREHENERSVEPWFGQICELADGWDIPDEVNAKIYKLKGKVAMDLEEWAVAVKSFECAGEYGAKVKTVLDKARKRLSQGTE